MTRDRNLPPHEPTPDQLAAYFDGELTGSARAEVEDWLNDHGEASPREAAFADHDDDLTRAWQMTQPTEPAPDAWASVLARINDTVPQPAVVPPGRRRVGLIFGSAAAAAAVVAIVLIGRALWPAKTKSEPDSRIVQPNNGRPDSGTEALIKEKEPFAVLLPNQVRIISMEGDDTHVEIDGEMVRTFVVGEPPVADTVMMPTSAERLKRIWKADSELHYKDWGVPMFIDPVVLDKDWQP